MHATQATGGSPGIGEVLITDSSHNGPCAPIMAGYDAGSHLKSGVLTGVRAAVYQGLMSWACPRCDRNFRRAHQRHACGIGSTASLLKDRPPALTALYQRLESTVRRFGDVEVVTRDRYALLRVTRIFADLTVTRDALRVVIHLGHKASASCFIKIGQSGRRISHVSLVKTTEDLRAIAPFLREAFDLAVREEAKS